MRQVQVAGVERSRGVGVDEDSPGNRVRRRHAEIGVAPIRAGRDVGAVGSGGRTGDAQTGLGFDSDGVIVGRKVVEDISALEVRDDAPLADVEHSVLVGVEVDRPARDARLGQPA